MWKLAVRQDRSATLVCEDGIGGVVYTENIPFTDFPMRAVTLWFSNGVICLPSGSKRSRAWRELQNHAGGRTAGRVRY